MLRLHTTIVTSYFDHRTTHTWSPTHLHDQQLAGAVLWCVAELIDLPFLLLVYLRWLRADERDAAEIDTVLEAERIARGRATTDGRRPARDRRAVVAQRPDDARPLRASSASDEPLSRTGAIRSGCA